MISHANALYLYKKLMITNRIFDMSKLKTLVTTLFFMVLCYGVYVPDHGAVVKGKKIIVTDTTKK